MKKITILFDLDGTLIDSTEAILESFKYSLKRHDSPIFKDEEIKNLIGYTLEDMFRTLNIEEKYINSHVINYKLYYRTIHTKKTKLLDGAKEAILEAYKFANLAVVTTKTGKYSKELLKYFGLLSYFDTIIGREDVINPKPDKEPILRVLSDLNIKDKNRVYMIGDTPLDIICANSAGVKSIGVTSGYSSIDILTKYTNKIYPNSIKAVTYIKKYEFNNR